MKCYFSIVWVKYVACYNIKVPGRAAGWWAHRNGRCGFGLYLGQMRQELSLKYKCWFRQQSRMIQGKIVRNGEYVSLRHLVGSVLLCLPRSVPCLSPIGSGFGDHIQGLTWKEFICAILSPQYNDLVDCIVPVLDEAFVVNFQWMLILYAIVRGPELL